MSSMLAEFPDLRWAASRAQAEGAKFRGYPLGGLSTCLDGA